MSFENPEGHRPPGYYLSPDDWPTDVPRDDLTVKEVYRVVDDLDEETYQLAIDGLRKVKPSRKNKSE